MTSNIDLAALVGLIDGIDDDPHDAQNMRMQERMLDDPKFTLEVAAHECAHAYWAMALGAPVGSISLLGQVTDIDLRLDPLFNPERVYKKYRERVIGGLVAGIMVPQNGVSITDRPWKSMSTSQLHDVVASLKIDFPSVATARVSPVLCDIKFPAGDKFKSGFSQTRILWKKTNPFYRELTNMEKIIMGAISAVQGPFFGKTWSSTYGIGLGTESESKSFTDWLVMGTTNKTEEHHFSTYNSHGKTRYLWHTAAHMVIDCGGMGDYGTVLDKVTSEMCENEHYDDRLDLREMLSGFSAQDVIIGTFLSPFMITHVDKARVAYAIGGAADVLIEKRVLIGDKNIAELFIGFLKEYDRIHSLLKGAVSVNLCDIDISAYTIGIMKKEVSKVAMLRYLKAVRWHQNYKKYIDDKIAEILNTQFNDASDTYFRAVDHFNDALWTPVVSLEAYNKYKDPNWFTWTDKPFSQGRYTP
ncbi:hypothetical protein HAP94_08275 [Acidithiobacillus ferrivorans]|nr:hypothetical protein [Acidithiobacillus ferrivorans]